MSDPERLIQDGDDFVQVMLRAGQSDGPSEVSRHKVAAGLGLGAAAHSASWSAAGLVKWVSGTVVAVALVGGVGHLLRHPEVPATSRTATTEQAIPRPPAPMREPARPERVAVAEATPPVEAPTGSAPARLMRRPAKAAPGSAKTKKNASTLDAETALLDGARASLRAGRAEEALRALDGYDTRFPVGLLVPEATVVRIEALVKRGDKAGALRLGERFLRAYPGSPLAARVRSLTNS